jgi:hypothetical protein
MDGKPENQGCGQVRTRWKTWNLDLPDPDARDWFLNRYPVRESIELYLRRIPTGIYSEFFAIFWLFLPKRTSSAGAAGGTCREARSATSPPIFDGSDHGNDGGRVPRPPLVIISGNYNYCRAK